MKLQRFLPNSLKLGLTLITVLIFVISLWSLAYYAGGLLRKDMQRELGEQRFLSVKLIAAHLDEELVDRMRARETIAAEITPAVMGKRASVANAAGTAHAAASRTGRRNWPDDQWLQSFAANQSAT